jgi:hypothetical protein
MIYKLTLYSCGAPEHCTCEAGYNDETGVILVTDFSDCAFTKESHKAAIERAMERLGAIKSMKEKS